MFRSKGELTLPAHCCTMHIELTLDRERYNFRHSSVSMQPTPATMMEEDGGQATTSGTSRRASTPDSTQQQEKSGTEKRFLI